MIKCSYSMEVKLSSPFKIYIEASNVKVVNIKGEGYVTCEVSPSETSVMSNSPATMNKKLDSGSHKRSSNVWDRLYYNISPKRKRTTSNEQQAQIIQSLSSSEFHKYNDAEINQYNIGCLVSSDVSNKTEPVSKHNIVNFRYTASKRDTKSKVIFYIFFKVFKSTFMFLVVMLLLWYALSIFPNVEQSEINGIARFRSIEDSEVKRRIVSLVPEEINKNS